MPFKFGAVAVTSFPLLHVAATVATGAGTRMGYAADNLMPKWFDKAEDKTVGDNSRDLAISAEAASRIYQAAGRRPRFLSCGKRHIRNAGLPVLRWD
jgi:hypothetical protein